MAGIDQYNPIRIHNGHPLDAWYLNGKVPYTSVAEVLSLIPLADRSVGLTVLINTDEYWFKGGTADDQLIFKSSGSDNAGSSFSGDYNDLINKPALATVSTSGNYTDLSNTPALAAVAISGLYDDLTGKPGFATVATSGSYNDLTDKPVTSGTYEIVAGTGINISGTDPKTISAVGTPGTNPSKIVSIEDYGGVADYAASGTTMTGTDNSAAAVLALDALPNGGTLVIPHGNWYWPTRVALPTTKSVNIEVYGNLYCPNGGFSHVGMTIHRVVVHGSPVGRLGITGHSKTHFLDGTGMNNYGAAMNWNTLAPAFFYFNDVYRGFYSVKEANGFEAVVHFYGGTTANQGGQELTIQGNYWNRNKHGIWLQSADGTSYIDKITFSGLNGGTLRIGGHLAIFIDGHSTRTGAARSNNFCNILTEYCNYGIKITGDATYNKFIGHRWEGGTETGHFAASSTDPAIKARAYIDIENPADVVAGGVAPRGTQFIGCSHVYVDWLTHIGNQTIILGTPIWNRNAQVMFGSYALGQENGRITVYANVGLSSFSRSQLPTNVDYVALGNATPSPTTDSMLYSTHNGTARVEYIQKYSGSGTSQWIDDNGNIRYPNKVGIGLTGPTARLDVAGTSSPSTVHSGGIKLRNATLLSVAENHLFENDGTDIYFTLQNIRRKFLMRPNGGAAYQMMRMNAAMSGLEFIDQPYSLEYSQTSLVTYTNSTTSTSVLQGGTISLKPWAIGNVIDFRGSGEIDVIVLGTNVLSFHLNVAGRSRTFTRTMTNGINNQRFDYHIRVTVTGSSSATIFWKFIMGNDDTRNPFTENITTGINTTSPTFQLNAQWGSGNASEGNTVITYQNTVEYKRRNTAGT